MLEFLNNCKDFLAAFLPRRLLTQHHGILDEDFINLAKIRCNEFGELGKNIETD